MTAPFAIRFLGQVALDLGKVVACVLGVVAVFLVALTVIVSATGTDVEFQSSDGRFHAHESHWKGAESFDDIREGADAYVRRCHLHGVRLERLTAEPNWLTPTRYFDRFEDPKWRVPLAAPLRTHPAGENGRPMTCAPDGPAQ